MSEEQAVDGSRMSGRGSRPPPLYRRWPSKAEVVLEAFIASAAEADHIDSGLEETVWPHPIL